jgi:hypothetical protein
MKNIHVIPTDKPSRLWINTINGELVLDKETNELHAQNIYITSDEEDINENDYIITADGRLVQVSYLLSKDLEGASKVILTTDQDLIKDGVQAIDDEFLEWFVKNPSCEYIQTTELSLFNGDTGESGHYKYEIIIPQEEPKQYPIGGYAPGNYMCTCVICKQRFFGDKRAVQCEPCAILVTKEEPKNGSISECVKVIIDKQLSDIEELKQEVGKVFYESADKTITVKRQEKKPHSFCETPEEKCTMNYCDENGCQNRVRHLVEPKQEQDKKMYNEEDMIEFAVWMYLEVGQNSGKERTNKELFKEWFEQFKKEIT